MTNAREFYIVAIFSNNDLVSKEILSKLIELSSKGFRRFIIYVVSPIPKPLYIEKLRNVLSNNISSTLVVKHIGSSHRDLDILVDEIKDKPHLVLVFPDMGEYYSKALSLKLNVEKIS